MNIYIIQSTGLDLLSLLSPSVQSRYIGDRTTCGLHRWPAPVSVAGSDAKPGSPDAVQQYLAGIVAVLPATRLYASQNPKFIATLIGIVPPGVEIEPLPESLRLTGGYEDGIDAALIMRETTAGHQWWLI